jgi:hypothetical protein
MSSMNIREAWEATFTRLLADEYEYVGEAVMFNFSRQKMQDAMDLVAIIIEAHKKSTALSEALMIGDKPAGDVNGQAMAWQKVYKACNEVGLRDFMADDTSLSGTERVIAFIRHLAERETVDVRTQKLETALKWAMDTIDAYDAEFVRRGDSRQVVYSRIHVRTKQEVRKLVGAQSFIPPGEPPTKQEMAGDKALKLLGNLDQRGGLGHDVHERIREILKEADGVG